MFVVIGCICSIRSRPKTVNLQKEPWQTNYGQQATGLRQFTKEVHLYHPTEGLKERARTAGDNWYCLSELLAVSRILRGQLSACVRGRHYFALFRAQANLLYLPDQKFGNLAQEYEVKRALTQRHSNEHYTCRSDCSRLICNKTERKREKGCLAG